MRKIVAFKDKFVEFQNLYVSDDIGLRQVDPEHDLEAYWEIYSDSEAFKYYTGYNHPPKDMAIMKTILNNQIKSFNKAAEYNWTIAESSTDKAIGRIILWGFENNNKTANIGYFLKRDYWGKGVISACIKPVVQFAFDYLNLERVSSYVMVENIGSWKALERNGFTREGKLRHCFLLPTGLHDCYIYAKLYID